MQLLEVPPLQLFLGIASRSAIIISDCMYPACNHTKEIHYNTLNSCHTDEKRGKLEVCDTN